MISSLGLSLLTIAHLASAALHVVNVGQGGLVFSPDTVTAAVGDSVEFRFYPSEHSVAQSDFANPCVPLADGFFSGFLAGSATDASEAFTVTVNNTSPIWYYCSHTRHCNRGMAGVINPTANSADTLKAYQAAAGKASGSSPASVQGGVLGAVSASASASTSTVSAVSGASSATGTASTSSSATTSAVSAASGASSATGTASTSSSAASSTSTSKATSGSAANQVSILSSGSAFSALLFALGFQIWA